MIYNSTSKFCHLIYSVVFGLLAHKVIQFIRYWLCGALALTKPSLNRPTSGAARTKKLHSLPLTLSISKTGENTSGMNGNEKFCYLSGNLLKICDRYYQAYLGFFIAEVKVKSFNTILEEYIFAPKANFVQGDGKQPEMLTRLFAGLLHPLIHTGFGVEFNLPGTFAEGTNISRSHLFIN